MTAGRRRARTNAAAGNCRVETWSYVGTGRYGASNPTVLTFSARPTLFIIVSHTVVLFGVENRILGARFYNNTPSGIEMSISWSGNTASFYATNDSHQANETTSARVIAFYA